MSSVLAFPTVTPRQGHARRLATIGVRGTRLPERRFQTWPMRLAYKGNASFCGFGRKGRYQAWHTFRDVFDYLRADREVAEMMAVAS